MQYMNNVLLGYQVPEDAGVAIEYRVPLTAKRVAFILTGHDAEGYENAVIELKQWSAVEATEKAAVVITVINGTKRDASRIRKRKGRLEAYVETIQGPHHGVAGRSRLRIRDAHGGR